MKVATILFRKDRGNFHIQSKLYPLTLLTKCKHFFYRIDFLLSFKLLKFIQLQIPKKRDNIRINTMYFFFLPLNWHDYF
jgi:hypothetical protein